MCSAESNTRTKKYPVKQLLFKRAVTETSTERITRRRDNQTDNTIYYLQDNDGERNRISDLLRNRIRSRTRYE